MRAYYTADRTKFFGDSNNDVLAAVVSEVAADLKQAQRIEWQEQIPILREALRSQTEFTLFLEFVIPRMAKRADAVLVAGGCIFVIEFKRSEGFSKAGTDQVEDYALDLQNFHERSHGRYIVPILVSRLASKSENVQFGLSMGQVEKPLSVSAASLGDVLSDIVRNYQGAPLDAAVWAAGGYRPTPTIIEAACALYARHDVHEIARSDADAQNLGRTQEAISAIIEQAKNDGRKSVCFVTGVPGAGKTLAGLNIATQRSDRQLEEHATFLSGNGPLVDVLREALTIDQSKRERKPKSHVARKVAAFVQNIHEFRDWYARHNPEGTPSEHVVIFDEAQRAWTRDKASSFMKQKKGVADFNMSEPEFLLSVMDRHHHWCTVICLIGGGQEINTGEAGLSEWMAAVRDHFPHWRVHASAQIVQPDYNLNAEAEAFILRDQVALSDDLHLGVSMRSFRAETLSNFVSHVLNGDADGARNAISQLSQYPLFVTRNLQVARRWLRETARGSERYGLVASSGALRLRPEGLHVKADIEPVNWFLRGRDDVRSSYYLEDVASEFDVQGLELEYTAVCWDADFRYAYGSWQHWNFSGTVWKSVRQSFQQRYLKNAYRVILTRARQGMVVFVPKGDASDATRLPEYYDDTYNYLLDCGFTPIV